MQIVFLVVTGLLVLVIALVAVGRVTAQLDQDPPLALFDADEALAFVADGLPDDVTAQVSYDDVGLVLGWLLEYLDLGGVVGPIDERSDAPVVDDAEATAFVFGKVSEVGLDIDDLHVVAVLESALRYLAAIGSIGSPVESGD